MTGYEYHYNKAKMEFVNWYYDYHTDRELASFWDTNCGHIDDMLMYDDELKFALEAFEDSGFDNFTLVYHYELGEHCLKIKWEVNPWWPKQVLHFYYCVMLPIDHVELKTPSQLIADKLGEEE